MIYRLAFDPTFTFTIGRPPPPTYGLYSPISTSPLDLAAVRTTRLVALAVSFSARLILTALGVLAPEFDLIDLGVADWRVTRFADPTDALAFCIGDVYNYS